MSSRKRNSNPIKDEVSLSEINGCDKPTNFCYSLCEIDLTNTKELQQSAKHCIRIAKLMADPKSRFNERDSYGYDSGLLYHLNRENGKMFKSTVVPKNLIKTLLQEMHDHFDHFGIGKMYSLIKRYNYWHKMIKHIQAMLIVALFAEEKSYQLRNISPRQQRSLRNHLLRSQLIL